MVDKELFHQLYLEYYPRINLFFRGKGFPPEDAEELTQEVFIRVYRFEGDLKDSNKFLAWLSTIAANTWKNKIRELRSLKRDAIEIPLDVPGEKREKLQGVQGEPNAWEKVHQQELKELLRQAISQLPETVYACMVLRVYHQKTYEQIAMILGIPYETVKSRLFQAQKKLKGMLKERVTVDLLESQEIK